jgi:hypothetical protein
VGYLAFHVSSFCVADGVRLPGHDKPLIAFMGRLVERRPASALLITFLVSSSVFLNLRRELGLMPGDMLNRVK